MDKSVAGSRKRQQISSANKMMFLWIAGVSVVVGVSIVLMVFLVQKIWHGEKVIAEKNKTVSVLDKNLSNVTALRDNIRVLNTNEDLNAAKLNDSDSALQPVLDALPADANPTALASSLQTKLLTGVPGVVVETLNVEPVSDDTATGDGVGRIGFTFSVSADSNDYTALRQVLERLEKSIRPFNVTNLTIESQGKRLIMTATGESFYSLAKKVELTQKVVKP